MKFWKRYFPVLLIGIYFLALAHRGLTKDFNTDDMMNLGVAFLKPFGSIVRGTVLFWTGYIRPLGALFYLAVYAYAGFWSIPFHVACFVLILVNLGLAYRLFLLLTRSRLFSAIALLVFCYQASMSDIYISSGTVYDILCQLFFLGALNLCVAHDGPVSAGRLIGAALCSIAAVDAKEVGVSIPAVLLAYELIFHRPAGNLWRWTRNHMPPVFATGVVSLIFMWSRLVQKNELSEHEFYKVTLTIHQYLLTTKSYINHLLYYGELDEHAAAAVLLAPLLAAALLRSRLILFGWIYYVLALAPMSFSIPRFGYALYIPYTGAAIIFGALALELDRRLNAHARARAMAAVLFAGAIIGLQIYQNRLEIAREGYNWGEHAIYLTARGVASRYPSLRKGSRLLLVNDPCDQEQYLPKFVLWLRYHDPSLTIDRSSWKQASGAFQPPTQLYDHVFLFAGDKVWEMRQNGASGNDSVLDGFPPSFVVMRKPEAELSIVKDIGGIGPGEEMRWVNQDPTLSFRLPKQPAAFRIAFEVPEVILARTGPLRIQCWIGGKPAPGITVAEPGPRNYEAPVPAELRSGDVVPVHLHIENPYIASGDGARLGFLLRSAGFLSK